MLTVPIGIFITLDVLLKSSYCFFISAKAIFTAFLSAKTDLKGEVFLSTYACLVRLFTNCLVSSILLTIF